MSIKDQIANEVAALRSQAAALNDQANAKEAKLASLPAEVEALTDEAWQRVKDWFSGL